MTILKAAELPPIPRSINVAKNPTESHGNAVRGALRKANSFNQYRSGTNEIRSQTPNIGRRQRMAQVARRPSSGDNTRDESFMVNGQVSPRNIVKVSTDSQDFAKQNILSSSAIQGNNNNEASINEESNLGYIWNQLSTKNKENDVLKIQLRQMQEALVEKFRGNSKFVSGGQFRSPHHSPAGSSKICSNCSQFRQNLRKLKADYKDLQIYADECQLKLSESLVVKNSLMENLNAQSIHLREKENYIVDQNSAYNKLKEDILHLQEKQILSNHCNGSCDNDLDALKKEMEEFKRACELSKAADNDSICLLKKNLDRVESENMGLSQKVLTLTDNINIQKKIVQELSEKLSKAEEVELRISKSEQEFKCDVEAKIEEIEKLNFIIREVTLENESRKSENIATHKESIREISSIKLRNANLKSELDTITDKGRKSLEEIRFLEKKLIDIQLNNQKSQSDIKLLSENKKEVDNLLLELNQKNANLESRLAEAVQAKNENLVNFENLNSSYLAVKSERNAAVALYDEAKRTLTIESGKLKVCIDDKLSLQNDCLGIREQNYELKNEVVKKNASLLDLEAKYKSAQSSHIKALEKAMQSVVRLCVVAPTVNVHLSGDIIPCKALLPQVEINNIVQRDILPMFSSIFIQSQEGKSPDGTNLDVWLQSLLKEMQHSIERHLKTVFQG